MKKKGLLLAVAMMATTVGFAQNVANKSGEAKLEKNAAFKRTVMKKMLAEEEGTSVKARRSYSDGFYFSKPKGSMYRNFDLSYYGYGPTFLVVPPFEEMVFTDESSSKATNLWSLYGGTDVTSYKDADYNLDLGYLTPGYMYPGVILTSADGTKADSLASNNYYFTGGYPSYYARISCDSIGTLGFVDDHTGAYGWGALSTAYLFGTGTRTFSDGTVATSYAAYQEFPKPMSPLYVEDVKCAIYCDAATPLADGVTLTMTIYNAETQAVLKTLTATSADVVGMERYGTHKGYLTGEYYGGDIVFADKQTDAFGNAYHEPFTIDCPTAVVISGFDQDGANVCITGVQLQDEDYADFTASDGSLNQGLSLLHYTDSEGETQTTYFSYKSPLALNITFRGVMDKVIVADELYVSDVKYTGVNILRAPDAGGVATCESVEGLNFAYVQTAMDWFDENGGEMYYPTEDLPDWLSMKAEAQYDETYGSYTGVTYLTFTADALPSGTTGRSAIVYIEGRGVTGTTAIEILQGDAQSGINSVAVDGNSAAKANANIYNLNGQRVTKNAKGILIQNGKKFINK